MQYTILRQSTTWEPFFLNSASYCVIMIAIQKLLRNFTVLRTVGASRRIATLTPLCGVNVQPNLQCNFTVLRTVGASRRIATLTPAVPCECAAQFAVQFYRAAHGWRFAPDCYIDTGCAV